MPEFNMPTTQVDVLRHAECEGGSIFRGSTDVPLSDAGWARLKRVTEPLSGWDTIVTSPLTRCRAFADWLAEARGLDVVVDPRFREMNFGDWEGVPITDVWNSQPELAQAWYVDPGNHEPPNAEKLVDIRARVAEAWADLVATHEGRHVLLVCHGGVIRNLVSHVLDLPLGATNRFGMPYGCRSRIDVTHSPSGSMARLMGYNLDNAE
ncbi:histidine phosphatase family protein [Salinisphaera sp. Q1T1-3]|uniref:histidine phosphatase family protein n=1 Tax=Salinisphaera sp. Q1T1-3 TaxID=2321229 RepID=UPI000E7282EE|nr:histidine phosphatase family protein [Salinisphaera sp. Q1T1-3]RJS92519.1 histidine phosphatase family protein [Salinisphaera sp. Q1T1-3]